MADQTTHPEASSNGEIHPQETTDQVSGTEHITNTPSSTGSNVDRPPPRVLSAQPTRYTPLLDSDDDVDNDSRPSPPPLRRRSRFSDSRRRTSELQPVQSGEELTNMSRTGRGGTQPTPVSWEQEETDELDPRLTHSAHAVDLRALDYVTDFDDQLMCAICRSPYIKPVRLNCDHIFCQRCFDRARTQARLNAGSNGTTTCPSCRSPVEAYLGVPRIITNMIDDLKVRCPLEKEGCKVIVTRGSVQAHVDKYCQYVAVVCPDPTCDKRVLRKYVGLRTCLHKMVPCSKCGTSVMQQDVELHNRSCSNQISSCPDCKATISPRDLEAHLNDCPEAVVLCPASSYGCKHFSTRRNLNSHVKDCTIAALMPYLKLQNDRANGLEASLRQLKLRNDILEGGLSSIQNTLNRSSTSISTPVNQPANASSSGPSSQFTDTASTMMTPLPPLSSPSTGPIVNLPDEIPAAPFDSPTHHLLCLHESLRDEVSRISAALTDLDARSSMMLMNETVRIKEELAHTNAAVGGMRAQLHWLVGSRLLQQQRAASGAANTGSSVGIGPGVGVNGSGPSSAASGAAGRRSRSSDGSGGIGGIGGERTKL